MGSAAPVKRFALAFWREAHFICYPDCPQESSLAISQRKSLLFLNATLYPRVSCWRLSSSLESRQWNCPACRSLSSPTRLPKLVQSSGPHFTPPGALSPSSSDASDAQGCPNVPASAWDGRMDFAGEALLYCAGEVPWIAAGPCSSLTVTTAKSVRVRFWTRKTRFSACTTANIHTLYYLCFTTFYLFCFTTQITVCLHSPKGLLISWNSPSAHKRQSTHSPRQPSPHNLGHAPGWPPPSWCHGLSTLQSLTTKHHEPLTKEIPDTSHDSMKPEGSTFLPWLEFPSLGHLSPAFFSVILSERAVLQGLQPPLSCLSVTFPAYFWTSFLPHDYRSANIIKIWK